MQQLSQYHPTVIKLLSFLKCLLCYKSGTTLKYAIPRPPRAASAFNDPERTFRDPELKTFCNKVEALSAWDILDSNLGPEHINLRFDRFSKV